MTNSYLATFNQNGLLSLVPETARNAKNANREIRHSLTFWVVLRPRDVADVFRLSGCGERSLALEQLKVISARGGPVSGSMVNRGADR